MMGGMAGAAVSTSRPSPGTGRALLLGAAVLAATGLRALAGAPSPASSAPAAILFSAVLLAAVAVAGAGAGRLHWSGVALGVAGAALLVAASLTGLPGLVAVPRTATATLVWWAPLVTLVAVAEELVLRGALFEAIAGRRGEAAAVGVTAVLFAVIHLPLYGVAALPVDLCAGVFLGALRVLSGGVAAPAVAHALADLATGWLP